MSLLELKGVSKDHHRGRVERVVLSDVSLELEAGELVAVLGLRRSGRSTLLRIAAGMECPDAGSVHFDGRDLARDRDRILGREIGFVQPHFSAGQGGSVLEQVADGLLCEPITFAAARRRALEALADVGAESCQGLYPRDLDAGETVRVAVARALVSSPRLLVIDEPTNGVDIADRDPILRLLHSIANRGIAVLMSTGDGAALAGMNRVFTIDQGQLRGGIPDPLAPVLPLRRPARPAAGESGRAG